MYALGVGFVVVVWSPPPSPQRVYGQLLIFNSPLADVCVVGVGSRRVCVVLLCLGVNIVLVCELLVLDLVLLWFGLLPLKQNVFTVNF